MSALLAEDLVCTRIDAHLRALHLPGMLARYRGLAEEAGLIPEAYVWLEGALAAERASRDEHRLARNLKAARFPVPHSAP